MSERRDYYEVLGVSRNASEDEIKRAFRRLARTYHPDVRPDDPEAEQRFKEISQAYEVLRDPERRAQYDRYGHAGPPVAAGVDLWDDLGGLGSIFEAFFGTRGPTRARPRRGADLRYDLEVDLEEVATGVEKPIRVERIRPCPTCHATGSRSGTGPRVCPQCRGTGQVRHTTATPFGHLSTVTTCERCRGGGAAVSDPCPDCRGAGRQPAVEELTVKVPAGVENGETLHLPGEGEAGERGAPPGDLYVVVHVRPHQVFTRQGRDLHCELPISFVTAALGSIVRVPTLSGDIEELRIPAGTQHGDTLTIRGRGLPDARTGVVGSLHVSVQVVVPTDLTPRQREILEEFARESGDECDAPRGWFARLRDALRGEEEDGSSAR